MESDRNRRHINHLIVVTSVITLITGFVIYLYFEFKYLPWMFGVSGGPDLQERIRASLIFLICTLIYYALFHVNVRASKTIYDANKEKLRLFYIVSIVIISVIVLYYTFGESVEEYIDKQEIIKYENEANDRLRYYSGLLKPEYEFQGVIGMTHSETWYEFEKTSSVNKTDIEYLLSVVKPVDDLNIVISLNWNNNKSKIQVEYDKNKKFMSIVGSSSDKEAVKVVSELDGIERLPVINSVRAETRNLWRAYGAIFDDLKSNEETIRKNDGITYLYFVVEDSVLEQREIQYIADALNFTDYPEEKFIVSIVRKSENGEELLSSFKTDGKYSSPKKIEEIRR